mmetsp:Transcript_55367/g.115815  ORF Transcript_55367/g.115815 Transcript_55367/m.115815 type:complete len:122 (+) Transcript_55367:64-429(+)
MDDRPNHSDDEEESADDESEFPRRPWTKAEDELILKLVSGYGTRKWCLVAANLHGRSGKQCRERSAILMTFLHICGCVIYLDIFRYKNQLDPNIVKDPWTHVEDLAILRAQETIGNKWTEM